MDIYAPLATSASAKNIGQSQYRETYYVDIANSLRIDKDLRTIWLDLDSVSLSKNANLINSIPIFRDNSGTKEDFKILSFPEFYYTGEGDKLMKWHNIDSLNKLFEVFLYGGKEGIFLNPQKELEEEIKNLTLPKRITFLIDLINAEEEQVPPPLLFIKKSLSKFNSTLLLETLTKFSEFIKTNISKEEIGRLISNGKYTLLCGELTVKESLENNVNTLKSTLKDFDSQRVEQLFIKHFRDVIISEENLSQFIEAMGITSWPAGIIPEKGGAILHDYGGTGKSLLKSRLEAFIKDFQNEFNLSSKESPLFEEVTSGDISSYQNAGPQIVQRWFLGHKGEPDHISGKRPNLIEHAREVGIPSFLIIDEARDLILADEHRDYNATNLNTITPLKRFIQQVEKGGVTGYVIVLMIANMREDEIDNPLRQRGERLTPIWVGQPSTETHWLSFFNYIFNSKKLNFDENSYHPEILASLLLKNLSLISEQNNDLPEHGEEQFGISQRIFDDYLNGFKHRQNAGDEGGNFFQNGFLSNILRTKKAEAENGGNNLQNLNFRDFVRDVINNLLLPEVRKHRFEERTFRNEFEQIFSRFDLNEQREVVPISQTDFNQSRRITLGFVNSQIQKIENNNFDLNNFNMNMLPFGIRFQEISEYMNQVNFDEVHKNLINNIFTQLISYTNGRVQLTNNELENLLNTLNRILPRI